MVNINVIYKYVLYFFLLIIIVPFISWTIWVLIPRKPISVVILDKTVLNEVAQEHDSFNWVLNHRKYVRPDTYFYSITKDYYGFFPKKDFNFEIDGLEKLSDVELDRLANSTDVFYFTDAYGIYENEWFLDRDINERSNLIYGGMSNNDMYLLKKLKENNKLIISEFNVIASPTPKTLRAEFEQLFGMQWTEWVGRYFSSLDTNVNLELPRWLIRDYKAQHNDNWPFTSSGLAFVKNDGTIEILENKKHLEVDVAMIRSNMEGQKRFGLPELIKYPYWFDIMRTSEENNVISVYEISPTPKGDSILAMYGIPKYFPAVTERIEGDFTFYYFSGDFADNPLNQSFAKFAGVHHLGNYLYDKSSKEERISFFYKFYRPLLSTIMKERYQRLNAKD